jgi:hypothetical protein
VPLNKVWFLIYFFLYLFLYTSYRLYTYLFIISLVHSLQFVVHRIFIYFHINTFTHLPIYTFTHSLINTFTHLPINTFTHLHIHLSTHPHTQGSISTGKTRQCVEIVEVRKPLLQEDSGINHNTMITANILPQEGMAQGFYLYGGGGILPVAIVFILFYIYTFTHLRIYFIQQGVQGSTSTGEEGCHPYPPVCDW